MFPVPAAPLLHLLLEVTGMLVAMTLYQRLRTGTVDPIADHHRMRLLIAATFGALIGSRLVGALENPTLFLGGGGELGPLYYLRSKTIVGGLVGGLFAVELTKRLVGIRHRSGDLYVYPLLAAMVIGRLGCFLMGVGEPTYGLPSNGWLGIDLGDGIPRHPTSLYEIFFLLLLAWAGTQVQRHLKIRSGRLFMLFLSSYLVYRFLIGFLQPLTTVGGLGLIQWTCLLGLLWYLIDEGLSWRPHQTRFHARR